MTIPRAESEYNFFQKGEVVRKRSLSINHGEKDDNPSTGVLIHGRVGSRARSKSIGVGDERRRSRKFSFSSILGHEIDHLPEGTASPRSSGDGKRGILFPSPNPLDIPFHENQISSGASTDQVDLPVDLFDGAQREVFLLMASNAISRFLKRRSVKELFSLLPPTLPSSFGYEVLMNHEGLLSVAENNSNEVWRQELVSKEITIYNHFSSKEDMCFKKLRMVLNRSLSLSEILNQLLDLDVKQRSKYDKSYEFGHVIQTFLHNFDFIYMAHGKMEEWIMLRSYFISTGNGTINPFQPRQIRSVLITLASQPPPPPPPQSQPLPLCHKLILTCCD
eukprot:TRINITY_DN12548_c0_g1_i23.p1 TRINITY_DN12548_c0_g1~~TRINITY_DN12548_c0_g1_i23.p1  ORF type:complete len:334 (+),score=52.22 TRINITY_DN12548_c0_g1_i23:275-1276(+)